MGGDEAYDVPRRPCHLAVPDYFGSRDFTRWLKRRPAGATPPARSASMTRFETLERLRETEGALARTKEFRREERSRLDRRWESLAEEQSELRRSFIQFDKFIEENDHKRRRAAEKVREKDDRSRRYDDAIRKLRDDHRVLEELIAVTDSNVERHRAYEAFLDEVVRRYPRHFSCVDDVVGRFVTLMRTRDELRRAQEESFGRLEELRRTTASIIDRHHVELVGLGTRLAELRSRRDRTNRSCLEWEAALDSVLVEAIAKVREAVEAKDSCRRLYVEMCARAGVTPAHERDAARQLEHVKRTLALYRRVNEAIEERAGEAEGLSRVARASASSSL